MKITLFALAAAGFVAAQDFSGQPDCAIGCLETAIPQVGCELDDTDCQCEPSTQDKLIGVVGPCLVKACDPTALAQAQSAAAVACASYLTTAGSSSATSASASTSASSTTTTTTTSSAKSSGPAKTPSSSVATPSATPSGTVTSNAAAGFTPVAGALMAVVAAAFVL